MRRISTFGGAKVNDVEAIGNYGRKTANEHKVLTTGDVRGPWSLNEARLNF